MGGDDASSRLHELNAHCAAAALDQFVNRFLVGLEMGPTLCHGGRATITEPPIPTPGKAASMRPAERKRASPPYELAPQRQPGALVNKANKLVRFAIDTPRRQA